MTESLVLDFKASAALGQTERQKDELAKDISALANSAGGTLIYGITESNRLPTNIDGGSDPNVISREWLENVILSKVQPRLSDLRITPINLSSGANAYVISIGQSATGHMAADKRYYKRVNFQVLPMEDYEVRDLMRRATTPDVVVSLELPAQTTGDGDEIATLRTTVENRANAPAPYFSILVYLANHIRVQFTGDYRVRGTREIAIDMPQAIQRGAFRCYQTDWSPANQIPLFQGLPQTLTNGMVLVIPRDPFMAVFIAWEVRGPGMTNAGALLRNPSGALVPFPHSWRFEQPLR